MAHVTACMVGEDALRRQNERIAARLMCVEHVNEALLRRLSDASTEKVEDAMPRTSAIRSAIRIGESSQASVPDLTSLAESTRRRVPADDDPREGERVPAEDEEMRQLLTHNASVLTRERQRNRRAFSMNGVDVLTAVGATEALKLASVFSGAKGTLKLQSTTLVG